MEMATASRSLFAQVESALRSKSSEAGIVVYDFESGTVLALREPYLTAERPAAYLIALNAPEAPEAPARQIRCRVPGCSFTGEKVDVWRHEENAH